MICGIFSGLNWAYAVPSKDCQPHLSSVNDFDTLAKRRAAFNTLAYSWRDTGGFAQGIYAFWDPYMKRSFPTGAANLPNPCGATAALQASDTVTNVFQCIIVQTTLTDEIMTP